MAENFYEHEHRLTARWRNRQNEPQPLAHSEVEELLTFPHWSNAVGDIIKNICVHDRLPEKEMIWLLEHLQADTFARQQVEAWFTLRSEWTWREKFVRLVENRVNWAMTKLLPETPIDEVDYVKATIKERKLPKWLLEALPQN